MPSGAGDTLADCGPAWIGATQLPPIDRPQKLRLAVISYRRSGRFFRTRVRYDAKAVATYDCCRLLQVAGDIELNPGPAPTRGNHTQHGRLRFSALLHNTQSLRSKLEQLRAGAAELQQYDIIALTETWLDDSIGDAELGATLPDHSWFRRDRGSLGGGVACAVRSSLLPTRGAQSDMDTETLLIQLGRPRLMVAICYRPPSDDAVLERMGRCLAALPGTTPLLVMGDINLPEIRWQAQQDGGALPELTRNSGRAARFLEQCALLGVSQHVAAPTRGPNVLDLVLVRGLQQVSAHPRAPSIASDHEEVVIGFSAETPPPARPTCSSAYSYRRADFDGLRQALSPTPWDLLDDGDVEEAVSTFYTLVDAAVRDHVPVVTLKKKNIFHRGLRRT